MTKEKVGKEKVVKEKVGKEKVTKEKVAKEKVGKEKVGEKRVIKAMETLDRKATRGRGRAVRGAGNTTR